MEPWGSPLARWTLVAAVLGSGMAFLDATVVNVALPSMANDLHADIADLQWVLDAYLITLTALLLLGGSLGDRYGRRRVFMIGVVSFAIASVLCGAAPTTVTLVAARALQGAGAALLVPGSLALLSATIREADRPRAIGAWSGLAGVAGAAGPFIGGWLVDAASWRWAFLINVPLGIVVLIAARHVPESLDANAPGHLDVLGATAIAVGLASLTAGLIEGGGNWSAAAIVAVVAGILLLFAFVLIERRTPHPMLPLELFRSSQFTGANLVTLAVYAGLGGMFFFVVVNLQNALGYSALEAGAALTPATAVMLVLSARMGALSQKIGPRIPMTVGPAIAAFGLLLFGRVDAGDTYVTSVLPAALLFGLGMSITVAPLTSAVLGAVDQGHLGVGSGTNNAVSRLAGLLAIAVVPSIAGFELTGGNGSLPGYQTAMQISAGLTVIGAVIAFVTIDRGRRVRSVTHSILQPCQDPVLVEVARQ
jgi:EmrB/QacA subfamily drug resistance transporter